MTTEQTDPNASQQQQQTATEQQTPPATTTSDTDLGGSEQTSQEASTTSDTDLGADDEATTAAADAAAAADPKPGEAFQGAPEGDTPYEGLAMPDGYEPDEELTSLVTPIAKELNLNKDGMQKLVDLKPKMDQIALARWKGHVADLKKEAQADPEIGGAKYAPAVAAGRAVIAKFGNENFKKMLNYYGIGAHPEMIRFMDKIAKATGETPTPPSEGGGTASVDTPLHELMYGSGRK